MGSIPNAVFNHPILTTSFIDLALLAVFCVFVAMFFMVKKPVNEPEQF